MLGVSVSHALRASFVSAKIVNMNNASDYLTGDDMMAHLVNGIHAESEAATFAPDDMSREAVIARDAAAFIDAAPERGALIGMGAVPIWDARSLEALGLIAFRYFAPGQTYMLTDAGAALAKALR